MISKALMQLTLYLICMVELTRDVALKMYELMVKIRYFEDTIRKWYWEGKAPIFDIGSGPIPGEMHLAAGQEPASVGVMIHLTPADAVFATHRLTMWPSPRVLT